MNRPQLAATVLIFAIASDARAQVFFVDFESDPILSEFAVSNPASITTAQAHSGTHSYSLDASSFLYTPYFPYPNSQYTPGKFVELSFFALSPTGSQTAATPAWGSGVTVLQPGTQWTENKFIFRVNPGQADKVTFYSPNSFVPGSTGPFAYLDDVKIQIISRSKAAQIQDNNFATLMPKPYSFVPPTNRHQLIPNAINKLTSGNTLKATMLGDSIIADMYASTFEGLVERKTGGTLQLTQQVAGGAGAIYWSQNNRMQDVMATNPDLLMWGGISQLDIPSLRSVIQQARAINPNIEILLMSPIAGPFNPLLGAWLAAPADPSNGGDYRNDLIALSYEQNVQYWDLTTPWASYILNSGLNYSDFLRDPVHTNGRGQMLAGMIMESYFTPVPVPEPGTLVLTGFAFGAAASVWRRRRNSKLTMGVSAA